MIANDTYFFFFFFIKNTKNISLFFSALVAATDHIRLCTKQTTIVLARHLKIAGHTQAHLSSLIMLESQQAAKRSTTTQLVAQRALDVVIEMR